MAKRFVGIGVGQGDAFFLETEEGFTALIDGGRSVVGFPSEFRRATGCDRVDVIVCTHNDSDHANGVIGFLQEGLSCNEVWLPGSWRDRLEDLFYSPRGFTDELIGNIATLRGEVESLEQVATDFDEAGALEDRPETNATEGLVEGALGGDVEEFVPEWDWPCLLPWYPRWVPGPLTFDERKWRLFLEAVGAGKRIRQITKLAYDRGCPIRWFEFSGSGASGGMQGKLVPVNARQVLQVRPRKWSALMYLALTVVNKQSLVFLAPQDNGPGILFTADSDLKFSHPISWHDGMVITAPHHGAEANAPAYERFKKQMPHESSSIWVRSDGRSRSRPGPSFLNLKVPRFCTICRPPEALKQDLAFTFNGLHWQHSVRTRKCSCR